MEKTIYTRSVRFRDANQMAWNITFELRKTDYERTNRVTLQKFHETQEVSFTGSGPTSSGQCQSHITPRTESQEKLLHLWERFHLCGMRSGTDKQSAYLSSLEYKAKYDRFVEAFSGYDKDFRIKFDNTAWRILCNIFQFSVTAEPWIQKVISSKMDGNPILYILGNGETKRYYNDKHDEKDYSVQCFFLAMQGLYNDRGYIYGTNWLYEPVPADMKEMVDKLFDEIENEEIALTESLNPMFDMGAEDFKATPKIIHQVMELRDCGETEAKRFIALGMELGYTFGDLNNTFEVVDDDNCLYRADGQEYYVGTDQELYDVAYGYMEDGDYDEIWREAVMAEQTEMGLREWCKYVIDMDGWCSILNHWDGKYDDHKVGDDWICVSRT
jgi:hypothetical protein